MRIKPMHVRSEDGHDYFIDPARESLGEYFIDGGGREVFRNERDEPYYFGKVNGVIHRIIICPPFVPEVRSIAMPAAGISLGNGGYKKGSSGGNSTNG